MSRPDVERVLNEARALTRARAPDFSPLLGFILGSGLSGFASHVRAVAEIPYSSIPGFVAAGVEGHPGKLVLGHLEGVAVAVLCGRLHAYEGIDFRQVVYPVRFLATLGVRALVVTNAAGGLKRTMRPGDFMVVDDHINLTGGNPLRGPNWDPGPRFVDMTEAYDRKFSALLAASLKAQKARHHRGVYVGVLGPSYETAAEIRFYRQIGGDAVGMSTVAEVIAARHAGLRVAGLSCITNLGTGLSRHKLSHDEVKEVAERVEARFGRALVNFTKKAARLI